VIRRHETPVPPAVRAAFADLKVHLDTVAAVATSSHDSRGLTHAELGRRV
jgi:hypothetical protein